MQGEALHYWRKFQSTPLREGRRRTAEQEAVLKAFQSTPLREGRPRGWLLRYWSW